MIDESPVRQFMGIPIQDDSGQTEYDRRIRQQYPAEQLQPIIRAVLDDPMIHSFGWRQYTPYFNDGEECVFSTAGFWVRPNLPDDQMPKCTGWCGDDENNPLVACSDECSCDPEEYFTFPGYGDDAWFGRLDYQDRYTGPDRQRYDRVRILWGAIEDGHFYDVLRNQFGNHVTIAVTRDTVRITAYGHD